MPPVAYVTDCAVTVAAIVTPLEEIVICVLPADVWMYVEPAEEPVPGLIVTLPPEEELEAPPTR